MRLARGEGISELDVLKPWERSPGPPAYTLPRVEAASAEPMAWLSALPDSAYDDADAVRDAGGAVSASLAAAPGGGGTDGGGALLLIGSSATIKSSRITNNVAQRDGGAVAACALLLEPLWGALGRCSIAALWAMMCRCRPPGHFFFGGEDFWGLFAVAWGRWRW